MLWSRQSLKPTTAYPLSTTKAQLITKIRSQVLLQAAVEMVMGRTNKENGIFAIPLLQKPQTQNYAPLINVVCVGVYIACVCLREGRDKILYVWWIKSKPCLTTIPMRGHVRAWLSEPEVLYLIVSAKDTGQTVTAFCYFTSNPGGYRSSMFPYFSGHQGRIPLRHFRWTSKHYEGKPPDA